MSSSVYKTVPRTSAATFDQVYSREAENWVVYVGIIARSLVGLYTFTDCIVDASNKNTVTCTKPFKRIWATSMS